MPWNPQEGHLTQPGSQEKLPRAVSLGLGGARLAGVADGKGLARERASAESQRWEELIHLGNCRVSHMEEAPSGEKTSG